MDLLQPIPQKHKQLSGNSMKNYMPTKWKTWKKWTIPKHPHTTNTQTERNRKFEQTHNQ